MDEKDIEEDINDFRTLEQLCADKYFSSAFREISNLCNVPPPVSITLLESALKLNEREDNFVYPNQYDFRGILIGLKTIKFFFKKIFRHKKDVHLIIDVECLSEDLNYLANNVIGFPGLILCGITILSCSKPTKFSELEEVLYRVDTKELQCLKMNYILYHHEDFFERKLCTRIEAFSNLCTLCLQQNRIIFKKNPSLEKALSRALSNLPSLKVLNLSSNNLGTKLKSLLGGMTLGLEKLILSETRLLEEDLVYLMNSIHSNSLKYIDLSFNLYLPHLYEDLFLKLTKIQTVKIQPKFINSLRNRQFEYYTSLSRVFMSLPFLNKLFFFVDSDSFSTECRIDDLKQLRDILESIFTDLSLNNGVPIISDLRYLGEVETSTIYSCFNLFDGHNQTFKTSTRNLIGHATLKFISNDSGIAEIRGILKKRGIFHGNLKIILKNDTEIEAIAEDNYINGLVRTFKRVDNMDGKVYYGSEDVNFEIMGVEKYRMGKKTGPSYYFIPKSESLIFKRDETSDEKVYIPSALINSTLTTTCYQGKFIGNTLLEGILVSMTGFITEDKFIIPLFKPLQSESQSHNEPLVYPLLEDIVEHDLVYVNLSSVGGEGLFAKEDIPKGTIFAYYGGYRISIDEWEALSLTYPEYWIKIMEQNEIIYLPDELGMDTSRYKATLAHKINHSFENFNSYFKLTSHPKYKSMIPGVEALTFIPKGTEILCFYNDYFYESNPWFQDLWKQYYDDDEKNDHAIGLLGYGSTPGEPIKPMLSDIKLYKEFENYALTVLKLSAFV
ncbi:SETD7 [Lepeophtheirus salmonis]|uniref:SETD7 n=1 Tax=Lepeophtheirus salmonis TaxID=72036 RepID=A0A7R8H2W4_LEPSM|nr:SETD7 [Lepeophtheirus salmonis]CAF2822174.1 SETD7 [Lepeophtheirus salmonis]